MSRLAVSIGCPCGIGPEVSVAAAARSRSSVLLVGDTRVLANAAECVDVDPKRLVQVDHPNDAWQLPHDKIATFQPNPSLAWHDVRPGKPGPAAGAAQLAWVDFACDLVSTGNADALVTGPVSKDAIAKSGVNGAAEFRGHTEHLQRRLRAREVVMAFADKRFTSALVTTHIALARAPRAITSKRVATAIFWLADFLSKNQSRPVRIAITGVNPHAGESGLLGNEEITRILPGIELARARLDGAKIAAALTGPIAAEHAFRAALRGKVDGVVAMVHDQATIAMKLVGFGEAVNVSLGLPIIRTSVDHGTAYDLAGTGEARARGMVEAMKLAARLARRATS